MSISLPDSSVDPIWDPFKGIIRTLYLERNLSLEKVREEMANAHQFSASKAQYELSFSKWNFRKNRTAEDWKVVAWKVSKRKHEHKDSDVYVNGVLVNPKKVRKETSRYGSMPTTNGNLSQPLSPRIPEGFVTRTPSPSGAKPTSALRPFFNIPTPLHMNPHLLGSLTFLRPSQESTLFPQALGTSSATSVVSTQDIFYIFNTFNEDKDSQRVLGDHIRNAKALIPESTFTGNPETMDRGLLQSQKSSAIDFLKIITYLIANNFSRETAIISKYIYKGVKSPLNTGLLKYLLSIDKYTTEKLASNLFSLAIEASDIDMVKRMMEWGINPNKIAHSPFNTEDFTPLQHACRFQSVEVVQTLIDGGAGHNINILARGYDILSLIIHPSLAYQPYDVNCPHDSTEDGRYRKEQVKIKLIQILLRAGATVNPGRGPSPLAIAARFGYVEIVALLITAGSNVNFWYAELRCAPLGYAVRHNEEIPERDLFAVVRSLLQAGANVHEPVPSLYLSSTVLVEAIRRKSASVVQLLLDNGARITEQAFVMAAESCNLNTVAFFLKSGAQVTEEVIRHAAENEECETCWLLLNAAEDSIKHKCKCAVTVNS